MARFQMVITINTDPVLGQFYEKEDFLRVFKRELDRFPDSYRGRIDILELNSASSMTFTYADLLARCGREEADAFCEWAGNRFGLIDDQKYYFITDLNEYVDTKLSKLESSKQREDGSYECWICHGDVYACDCPPRRKVISTQQ